MLRRDFLASGTATAAIALMPSPLRAQTSAAAAATPGDKQLHGVFDQIGIKLIQRSPEMATQIGMDKGPFASLKSKLSERSPAAMAERVAATHQGIAAIEAVDPATLSPAGKLDREVVLYSMRSQLIGPEKFGIDSPQRPYPITQQQGAYFNVPDFLNSTHTIATKEDADAYLARLDAFATVLDQETALQKDKATRGLVAPAFALELALGQMAALRAPAPADNTVVASLARRAKAANLPDSYATQAAQIVGAKVYPALDRQMALVKDLAAHGRKDVGLWAIPNGDAIYAAALESATTTTFTPAQVHQMGLDQVAQISADLDRLLKAQGMSQGTIGERLAALNVAPAQLYPNSAEGRAQLLADLNAEVKATQARLPRAFNNPPNAPLENRAVPVEIQDGASNGYYYRAALDGSRPAIYWINLKDLGDWPKYSLPTLTHHEGVPGHHLQITIAQQAPTPMLRKLGFFNAYTEGWALYAEQLADELGAYDNDPLGKIGFLQSFLFRAARLVVDTGMHAKRWSREQATDYLVEKTGFARPRSQREIDRYCTMVGQACSYKIGHTSWVRARDRAKAILGPKFDIKQFHEILRDGALPLSIMERVVEERARTQLA